jgi:hypothetical protein
LLGHLIPCSATDHRYVSWPSAPPGLSKWGSGERCTPDPRPRRRGAIHG